MYSQLYGILLNTLFSKSFHHQLKVLNFNQHFQFTKFFEKSRYFNFQKYAKVFIHFLFSFIPCFEIRFFPLSFIISIIPVEFRVVKELCVFVAKMVGDHMGNALLYVCFLLSYCWSHFEYYDFSICLLSKVISSFSFLIQPFSI